MKPSPKDVAITCQVIFEPASRGGGVRVTAAEYAVGEGVLAVKGPVDLETSSYRSSVDEPQVAVGTCRLAVAVGRRLNRPVILDAVADQRNIVTDPDHEHRRTALAKLTRPGFLNNSFTPDERRVVAQMLKGETAT